MPSRLIRWLTTLLSLAAGSAPAATEPATPTQELNVWVKRSPVKGGPPSPGMGYETALGYDPAARRVLHEEGRLA
jgi:hypothetical protein